MKKKGGEKDKEEEHSVGRRWIRCSIEEEYLGENRKEGKIERKIARAQDRSKYKKTDQEKYLKKLEKSQEAQWNKQKWLEGRVISINPQGYVVAWENELIVCALKGLLKKEKTSAKNLVAVGDDVLFEKTAESEGIIAHVKPRRTVLSRADNLSRRKEQLIAVNIDQVIITASVVNPPLKPSIIDRYIIATRKGGMEPLIVVNKIDLFADATQYAPEFIEEEKRLYDEVVRAYEEAGVAIVSVSVVDGKGIEDLKKRMKGKSSVFSGQSGVGKSSLINAITGLELRTGEIVEKTKKGSHTTTATQLIPLQFGGWCVDTPGIKSFGIWDLKKEELDGYFPEILEIGLDCKFSDCNHLHEEDCAVIKALEEGKLSQLRYDSYQTLKERMEEEHVRR